MLKASLKRVLCGLGLACTLNAGAVLAGDDYEWTDDDWAALAVEERVRGVAANEKSAMAAPRPFTEAADLPRLVKDDPDLSVMGPWFCSSKLDLRAQLELWQGDVLRIREHVAFQPLASATLLARLEDSQEVIETLLRTRSPLGRWVAICDQKQVVMAIAELSLPGDTLARAYPRRSLLADHAVILYQLVSAPSHSPWVEPVSGRRGGGRTLIKYVIAESWRQGFSGSVELRSLASALGFYRKLGFLPRRQTDKAGSPLEGAVDLALSAEGAARLLQGEWATKQLAALPAARRAFH